jgi:hypothetical protein
MKKEEDEERKKRKKFNKDKTLAVQVLLSFLN